MNQENAAANAAQAQGNAADDAAPEMDVRMTLRLPKFTGKEAPVQIRAFLDQIAACMRGNDYDEHRITGFIHNSLVGEAQEWLNMLKDKNRAQDEHGDDTWANWTWLKPLFIKQYLPPLTPVQSIALTRELKQRSDQSVMAFWVQCNNVQTRLAETVDPTIRDNVVFLNSQKTFCFHRFLNGLNPKIAVKLLETEMSDYHLQATEDRLLGLAVKVESGLKSASDPSANKLANIYEVKSGDDPPDQNEEEEEDDSQLIEAIKARFQSKNGRGNYRGRFTAGVRRSNGNGKPSGYPNSIPPNNYYPNRTQRNDNNANAQRQPNRGAGYEVKCFFCERKGHLQRDCRTMQAAKKQFINNGNASNKPNGGHAGKLHAIAYEDKSEVDAIAPKGYPGRGQVSQPWSLSTHPF